MSKNFELIQQAEINLGTGNGSPTNGAATAPARAKYSSTGSNGSGALELNIDKLTREESQKLVQRVFLAQGAENPRVVVFAGIDHEAVWVEACIKTVIALFVRSKASQVVRRDSRARPRNPVGPGGMAIRPEKDDGLLRESACTQRRIDSGGMRPITDIEIIDHQHIAEAARFLFNLLGDELDQGGDGIAGAGVAGFDKRQAPGYRMRVRVNHARHQELALQVYSACH